MTIKSAEIGEFQCHRNSTFDFVPGMNVITGSSDGGKSASFRAFVWGFLNRPQGGAFKCWDATDADDVTVSFEFSEGQWFTKSRVKNTNKYEFEGGTLEALRTDVPPQIQAISQIDEYNIQGQDDPYFMLQMSGGERAKMLNRLVGLDIIDRLYKRLNGKVTAARQETTRVQAKITTLEAEIAEMSEVLSAESILTKLTSDIDAHTKTVGRADSLRKIIGNIRQYDAMIEQKSAILKAEEKYLALRANWDKRVTLINEKVKLNNLIEGLKNTEQDLADNLEWLQIEEPYQALALKIRTRANKMQSRADLVQMLNSIKNLDTSLYSRRTILEGKITGYTALLEKAGVCPICKSAITTSVQDSITAQWR